MARWEPQTAERLRTAALELFLEHGYDSVTVAQITERAGLTRRTFSRYFADKRDVLFAGSERLPPALADALLRADRSLPPFAALVRAITEVGEQLPGQAALAAQRRTIVQQSTELRERAGTKFAEATDALAEALRQRGTPAASAALLAEVGTALFRSAFERWTDEPRRASFGEHVRAAAAELAASLSAAKPAELTPQLRCLAAAGYPGHARTATRAAVPCAPIAQLRTSGEQASRTASDADRRLWRAAVAGSCQSCYATGGRATWPGVNRCYSLRPRCGGRWPLGFPVTHRRWSSGRSSRQMRTSWSRCIQRVWISGAGLNRFRAVAVGMSSPLGPGRRRTPVPAT